MTEYLFIIHLMLTWSIDPFIDLLSASKCVRNNNNMFSCSRDGPIKCRYLYDIYIYIKQNLNNIKSLFQPEFVPSSFSLSLLVEFSLLTITLHY